MTGMPWPPRCNGFPVITEQDPNARVILPGLAGNHARIFAFMDGYIDDPDGGIWQGRRFQQSALWQKPYLVQAIDDYRRLLDEGQDFFDIIDIHLYVHKAQFLEDELVWLIDQMASFGFEKPIWVIEGGGPFKRHSDEPETCMQGEELFGYWTAEENAEFVVKLHVLSAALGVERQHWGLGVGEGGYWCGPWRVMGLLDGWSPKPSYFTFRIMRQMLGDFTDVRDRSLDDTRVFEFGFATERRVIVAWREGQEVVNTDLSAIFGTDDVELTFIVTALDENGDPIETPPQTVPSKAVPLSITPVFVTSPSP